jgi:hypothetical protein
MTTMQPSTNTQEKKQDNKRQKSFSSMDIGTPQVPVRKGQNKQEHELLSDWEHAS